jgi:hypothetical protein
MDAYVLGIRVAQNKQGLGICELGPEFRESKVSPLKNGMDFSRNFWAGAGADHRSFLVDP